MILNDMQFCRTFAFVEALRMIEEKGDERGITNANQITLSTEGIKAIQAFTVAKATQFATLAFPNVSFPDETEREEIPLTLRDKLNEADSMDAGETELPLDALDDSKAYAFSEPTPGDVFTDNYLLA